MLSNDQAAFLSRVLQGDMAAVAFCETLFHISQVWDDLVDRDRDVPREEVDAAFWNALIAIPNNPFYMQHAAVLQPLMQAAIVDWMDATTLERGTPRERTVSYVLRDSLSAIVIHCARLIGGYEWMRSISPDVRRELYDEAISEYIGGLDERR